MGPLMIDVDGCFVTAEDKEILEHPLVGGLILFTRNYHDPAQLSELTQQIKKHAKKEILIAVDHEGGRVQRFRDGFSRIPAMGKLWQACDENIQQAQLTARYAGQLMALEVHAVGIDISFAPVLDLNGISDVIGDRGFHADEAKVTLLAQAFIDGMQSVGMKATGKHFPGHGSVKEDSHIALPVDHRSKEEIWQGDIKPFQQLIAQQALAAMMPAHIIFPAVDDEAVGFSKKWLQQILRQALGFEGVIFSDDLSMAGASVVGGFVERAEAAQQAGCDMLLMCNDRAAAIEVIDQAQLDINKQSQMRIRQMLKPQHSLAAWSARAQSTVWQAAYKHIEQVNGVIENMS